MFSNNCLTTDKILVIAKNKNCLSVLFLLNCNVNDRVYKIRPAFKTKPIHPPDS